MPSTQIPSAAAGSAASAAIARTPAPSKRRITFPPWPPCASKRHRAIASSRFMLLPAVRSRQAGSHAILGSCAKRGMYNAGTTMYIACTSRRPQPCGRGVIDPSGAAVPRRSGAAGARAGSPGARPVRARPRRSRATERKHMSSKTSGAGIQKRRRAPGRGGCGGSRRGRRRPGSRSTGRALGEHLARARTLEAERRCGRRRRRPRGGGCRRGPRRARRDGRRRVPGSVKSISSSGDIQATAPRRRRRRSGGRRAAGSRSRRSTAAASSGRGEIGAQASPCRPGRGGVIATAGSSAAKAGSGILPRSLPGRGTPGRRPRARITRPPSTGKLSVSPRRPAPPAISPIAIERPSVGEK